ncbi:FKBP-type peptidyl-prolyl cis-trans isomerase [Aliamphritea hakodatensis]|uniref:FKBP-type peptidyl-prolyl cis-trans isomerase n=1 Tax=Aliamphritea hakodatensis TaxID=2895352 RepID=UPI0022FD7AEB|nr:FKBP-type peptidyl-prolyl cis-trans isomerase [Aliamphritea hakodatensis]
MLRQIKYAAVFSVISSVMLLAGCGDDQNEAEFRRQLIEKALNDDVKKEGVAFLAENKQQPGIQETADGLQYLVIQPGSGDKPRLQDSVKVHYQGWRVDGELFESTLEQGEPSEFPLGGVIKGWRKALLMMPAGAKWKIFLPSELAYGAISPNEKIPANSALIFEIELLEIVPAQQAE